MEKTGSLKKFREKPEEKVDEIMTWLSILESEPEERDVGRLKTPPIKKIVEE